MIQIDKEWLNIELDHLESDCTKCEVADDSCPVRSLKSASIFDAAERGGLSVEEITTIVTSRLQDQARKVLSLMSELEEEEDKKWVKIEIMDR